MKKIKQNRLSAKSIIISVAIIFLAIPVVIFLLPRPNFKTGLTSLSAIKSYVATCNEQYAMDTENTIKPDFSKFYATMKPTLFSTYKEKGIWLGSLLHLTTPPTWSPSLFKKLLILLAKQRQADGYQGDQIVKITPTTESKIVVFGNIQGAMHSLTRCLGELKQLNIINDELKITNSDNFIVFTGDVVSRSPFTMPTLGIVCKLLAQNPKQVVYLRGNHESKNYWQEHTLKTELQLFASHLGKGDIPLEAEVNAFFNTLPIAAYISLNSENNTDFIRISDAGRSENDKLNESSFGSFLTSKNDSTLAKYSLDKKDEQPANIAIKVIFKGEKKRDSYQPHQGLRLLQPDMDSTAWTILSCPTVGYQKAIKFFHDAFAIIQPSKNPDNWTISLYNRDVRTSDTFKNTQFNLLSGQDSSGKQTDGPEGNKTDATKTDVKTEPQKTPSTPPVTKQADPIPQPSQLIDNEPSAFKPL